MSRGGTSVGPPFLCDTWWYALTGRLSDRQFDDLARLRAEQGFSAVQLVVGIPPDVGPENENALSKVGPAWNLQGDFNEMYLDYARRQIQSLNSFGLSVVVYGAWGQQIEWLGKERMKDWWKEIVDRVDDLDVMYCITGESDIWVGQETRLLPDKTTGDLYTRRIARLLHSRLVWLATLIIDVVNEQKNRSGQDDRRQKWSEVLAAVSAITNRPIFIHVSPGMTSREAVNNPELLDATTVQTGHKSSTRRLLWRLPYDAKREDPNRCFINLEPWYEGINGGFGMNDQLYAYWASMMGGADAYCYGGHGVWNAGDGRFLAHWGKQTLSQAMELESPRLIGVSHELLAKSGLMNLKNVEVKEKGGELVEIRRSNDEGTFVSFFPDVALIEEVPEGNMFLPLRGQCSEVAPTIGQVVVFS